MFKGTKNIIVFEQSLRFVLSPHCEHSFFSYQEYPKCSGFQALKTFFFLTFAQKTNSCTVIAVSYFHFL